MNSKKNRFISLLLVMVMLMTTLTACGEKKKNTSNTSTGVSGDQVELRFSWWGGDSRHEKTLKVIELFEEKHPNIKIKAEYAGWDGYQEKQTTQIAGGTEADIMQVNWNWLTQYSADGSGFYDLNEVKDILKLENYDEDMLELVTQNGVLNAMPVAKTGKVFYWNKTTFDKAGVEIPTNFDELKVVAEDMKEKLGDNFYPFASIGPYSTFLLTLYIAEQETGKTFIENNEVAYTEKELSQALKDCMSLVKTGISPSVEETAGGGNVSADQMPAWIEGRYAGIYEWDSTINKYESALAEGQELVVGEYLTGFGTHDAALTKLSMAFAISKNTKYPEEAATFINFLLSDPEAVKIMETDRGIPVNKEAIKTLEDEGLLTGIAYEGNKLAFEHKGKDISPYFEDTQLKKSYEETLDQLGYGKINEDEAAKQIIEVVNNKLESVK
ncbi:MAG: ABC transporter substrate-binding protein [Miniphocaeibacter sp.]|jgi:oligogalacturonide transport system substrate-binding protein|uniref:ABC transporter substrate-binding protein n=1 Tax=Miniphocaeibacter sp. TaxID=3100973 RepID=UPI0017C079DD|nr:carbohydrate ABC transporter substrate-binding protein [Gallicola sp.]